MKGDNHSNHIISVEAFIKGLLGVGPLKDFIGIIPFYSYSNPMNYVYYHHSNIMDKDMESQRGEVISPGVTQLVSGRNRL